MNPLTKVKLINELNEREANLGIKETVSWHSEYKDSAWIFVGGFPYELTEGDIICVFSQYGEMANINLVRDKKTGKSKGFCFICYEDQRSTILAVDNLNGIKIKGRTIRVDHVMNYRPPKDNEDLDDITKRLREEGCAPKMPDPSSSEEEEEEEEEEYAVSVKKAKKDKKEKKKKKKEKKKEEKKKKKVLKEEQKERHPQESAPVRVKQEKEDEAYDKYDQRGAPEHHGSQFRSPREDAAFRHRHGDQRDLNRERKEEEGWRDGVGDRKWEGGVRNRDSWRTGREEREGSDPPPRESGDRERERPRERERDLDRNRERERVSDRSRGMDRDRSRERDNDRNRDGDRYNKHKEGGSRESEHRRH
ncbi:RNA-binding motif protein, X-linked 2 [Osmerus mordax]|uniref:RNA-binding motif protein, X-linked 2 n=1 Tax=Osmerus mordax TaxID=8014 RepID=UPI00350EBE9B